MSGFGNFWRRFIDRGATTSADFIPVDADGHIIHLGCFGNPEDFSNIHTPMGQALAYRIVSPVRTIINRRASAFGNGRIWVLDKDGNEPSTTEANEARNLLLQPNPLQTWEEFYIQQKIYKNIFGFCPVYKVRPIGFTSVKALYNILPIIFSVELTGKLYMQTDIKNIIKSYKITFEGKEEVLEIDDVYISKDISTNVECFKVIPESRLCSLRYESAISNALGDAKFTMVAKRGALGILSNESKDSIGIKPISKEERQSIKREYRNYGLTYDNEQVIITEANLKWQQMAISTKELMLIELGDDATMRIADAYDYPYELLGSIKGVTFSNKLEAKKQFYQDAVVPEAKSDEKALTKFLGLKNCHVEIDFSEVPVLQEDKKLNSETLDITITALRKAYEIDLVSIEECRQELSNIMKIDPKKIPTNG